MTTEPIETFTWSPRLGPSGQIKLRVKSARFGDGYQQDVGDGLNNIEQSWPLAFTGDESYVRPIKAFLERHQGYKAFNWTPPLGTPGRYKVVEFNLTPGSGGLYTVTATLTQSFAP
ncbi:phage tail protein [Andreprevotia chitinilytica]|uniref:phage tail protein n=1 Tax=Andreprevotia chitinilytica TaxID=396808 RepID=UPI00054E7FB6|nr:phage tail protein [Andreprevotia chitinilytica]